MQNIYQRIFNNEDLREKKTASGAANGKEVVPKALFTMLLIIKLSL